MLNPSIILVRPQMGENIGAAARGLANFGLSELRLVAPRDGWPNPKASDTAGRALDVIDDAVVFGDVGDALADCQFVLATTARERALNLPVMEVRAAMVELHRRASAGEKCAVLFGPERTGLENEDMVLANAVVTIPVAPEYASLNVGQAVVVACYEWFQTLSHRERVVSDSEPGKDIFCVRDALTLPPDGGAHPLPMGEGDSAAPRAHLLGLFDQLEAALDEVNFWRVPEKKDLMWKNIRTGLVRAALTEQEVATWRGLVKALAEKAK